MPLLDLAALRTQIAARRLSPLHVFVGDDARLMAEMIDAVEATIDPADQPFAVDRLYAAEAGGSPIDIAAAARVLPMLGDRRLVIVMRAERLLKPKRASKTGDGLEIEPDQSEEEAGLDFGPLEDYVASPASFTTLLFAATDMDRTRRFTKRLIEKAQVTSFAGLDAKDAMSRDALRRDATNQLRDELRRAGRDIDEPALRMLVDRAGGDISKLRGDVERLLLYTEGQARISRGDVTDVTSIETQVDDWAVTNALAAGNAAVALREVAVRLDRGDSPHMMIGQLRWWVSNKLAQAAPARVKPALDALLRTDLALKSSGGEERALIERLVVDLASR